MDRRIAFVSTRDGDIEVYVMNADGSNPVNLTNGGALDPVGHFSPDGQRIAFYSERRERGDLRNERGWLEPNPPHE